MPSLADVAKSAGLRDIYNYINPGGPADTPFSMVNNSEMSDADFYSQLINTRTPEYGYSPSSFDYRRERQGDNINNVFSVREGSFLDSLNNRFGGVNFSGTPRGGTNEYSLDIDTTRMPRTRFGDVRDTAAVNQGTGLINPGMVYDDPNYGRITHVRNIKGNDAMVRAITGLFMLPVLAPMFSALPGLKQVLSLGRTTLSRLGRGGGN